MSMQVSPNLGRYGLRRVEVIRAYGKGAGPDLLSVPWGTPASEDEQAEYQRWVESLIPLPAEEEGNQPDFYFYDARDRSDDGIDWLDYWVDPVTVLRYPEGWTVVSHQALEAQGEADTLREEHDEWTAWIMDLMEAGPFLREVFGERERLEL